MILCEELMDPLEKEDMRKYGKVYARLAEKLMRKVGCKRASALGWTKWGTYMVDTDRGRQEITENVMLTLRDEWLSKLPDPYRGMGVLAPLADFGECLKDEEPKDPWLKLAKHLNEVASDTRKLRDRAYKELGVEPIDERR